MPKYYVVESGAEVTLTDKDFLAKGGEKSVYVKGDIAYCVYHDLTTVMPSKKIKELSVLSDPSIIRPVSELLNSKKERCGETMRFVRESYAPSDKSIKPMVLCHLFNNRFRKLNNVQPADVVRISDHILSLTKHMHSRGIIQVDPNETNWLVNHDLKSVCLIDTSCCQTPSYKGSIIKLAIRDWSQHCFNETTDWFSMAVVLGWLWVGAHPYMTYHPSYVIGPKDDEEAILKKRMVNNVSFFDSKTQLSPACRPTKDIPKGLQRWLEAVLQGGERSRPPDHCGDAVRTSVQVPVAVMHSGSVSLIPMTYYKEEDDVVYTPLKRTKVKVALDGKHLVLNGGQIPTSIDADRFFIYDNRVYVVGYGSAREVTFLEHGHLSASSNIVSNVADLPSLKVFEGCVIQNLLGKYLLTYFPKSGNAYTCHMKELDGSQILDAKLVKGNAVVLTEKSGKYKMHGFRFQESEYDHQLLSSSHGDINFTVNDRGIFAIMLPSGQMMAGRAGMGLAGVKIVDFPDPSLLLSSEGSTLIASSATKSFKVVMT